MSEYDRTAIQAVIGQKLDGQLQQTLADHGRLVQQKSSALQHQCSKAEKLRPPLSGNSDVLIHRCDDLEDVYACAKQDLAEKVEVHDSSKKSLRAEQLKQGHAGPKTSNSALQTILILIAGVFGEAPANAAFFSNAHMVAGPTAALTFSFLISLANVAACACAGYHIGRYLNYGQKALDGGDSSFRHKRIRAKLLFIGFIAVIGFFHSTVGLVRTQETIEAVNHSLSSYREMLQTPEAIFLILIGVVMSVIAYHKGVYGFGCSNPEIGRLIDAEKTAKQEVQDTFDFYQKEIVSHFDTAEKSAQSFVKEKKKEIKRYNKEVDSCLKARRQLERAVSEAESRCRSVLAEQITTYDCISGKEQLIPPDALRQMVSFERYLDVEIPVFLAVPDDQAFLSELMREKSKAVRRLAEIYQNAIDRKGESS